MADMLVNLNGISDYRECLKQLEAGECDKCFSNSPISCFIAVQDKKIIGYACYDATAPDFFGPTKVLEEEQKKGIGKALLLRTLAGMKEYGYQYAVIGSVGSVTFYEKKVGAVIIESSKECSVYDYMLKQNIKP